MNEIEAKSEKQQNKHGRAACVGFNDSHFFLRKVSLSLALSELKRKVSEKPKPIIAQRVKND